MREKSGKIILCFNYLFGLIFDCEKQNLNATFFTFFIIMFSTHYQHFFNSFFATIDIKSGNNIDIAPNAIVVSFDQKGEIS